MNVSMSPAEEKELILLALQGEQRASSALIRAYQERLYRFCFYLCGEQALAQDLVQDTLIKALGSLSSLRDTGGFQSWVFKIAKNLYLDHIKSPRSQVHMDLDQVIVGSVPDSVRHEPRNDVVIQVQTSLSRLPADDRLLLVLIDMEGHSYSEAGEIVGLSDSNVRFKLHHIRKAFLKHYQDE